MPPQTAKTALVTSDSQALLRARGEHLERGFCHLLDHGGQRVATLRGCEKLSKRHLCGAMSYNLSLLLRHLLGIGTPKQALAAARKALRTLMAWLWEASLRLASLFRGLACVRRQRFPTSLCSISTSCPTRRFSTGC